MRPRALRRYRSLIRPVGFLAALAVLSSPAVAQTSDPEAKQRDNRERRQALDTELDAARASEEQLTAELARLDVEVRAGEERAAAATARQAEAEQRVVVVRAEVGQAEAAVQEARRKAADQAVKAYMHPDRESATAILAARDPQELAKMKALMGEVGRHNHSIVQARVDAEAALLAKQNEAESAHKQAKAASEQAQAELAATNLRRSQQAAVRDELQRRIEHIREEQAALDAEQEQLMAIIASRQSSGRESSGAVSAAGFIWPADGPMTSGFGARWGTTHKGVDIGAPMGASIYAAADGEVFFVGTMGGYGNVVLVDHGAGLTTLYAHQSRTASTVGQRVVQRQVIGYIGSTGRSTGPHLHFEVHVNGTAVDPLRYLP